MTAHWGHGKHRWWLLAALIGLAGCDVFSGNDNDFNTEGCSIPQDQFASGGVPKDGIPALTDPRLVWI